MRVLIIAILSLAWFSALSQRTVLIQTNLNETASQDLEAFLDHSDRFFEANQNGEIALNDLSDKSYAVSVFAPGFSTATLEVPAGHKDLSFSIELTPLNQELGEVEVVDESRAGTGMSYLKYVEVDGIYAAKKNEIILPDEMPMNRSNNNSRQLFAKVPGINVQETDAGGLQMGVGVRGLDPKRTSNFNTRQDGYDISADALGYPESYYTPPIEAVKRVELVRGAASLQFGTQFGGLLNFKMKRGTVDRPLEVVSRQTLGSYQNKGSFNSVGGSMGEWNYYGYYKHRSGEGWRPNSHFVSNGFYAQVGRNIGARWSMDLAFTHHYYNAKQPGGLTDRQFETDPNRSFRDRNWFAINWNIASMTINGQLTESLTINSKTFALHGSRAALGFLGSINRVDTGGKRDLILGEFDNFGNETRLIQRFNIHSNPGAVLIGTRLYRGNTRNRQGKAAGYDGPDYRFLNPEQLEGSDFGFPSQNASAFAEVLLPINSCWYVTPGVRFEHITTQSDGYYMETNRHPLTNEILSSQRIDDGVRRSRNIALAGIGVAWRCRTDLEVYSNASQNYRAMNFSDLYVSNPNLMIANDLEDESGYTIDFGIKGKAFRNALSFDAGVFMMYYRNRIGEMLTAIENEEGVKRVVNYRDNIADARFSGLEVFEEFDFVSFVDPTKDWSLVWYNNVAVVDARYVGSEVSAFNDRKVENVPLLNYRTGFGLRKQRFSAGLQFNYVSQQFTDATNAEFFPNATVGVIPAYHVMDASVSYEWKFMKLEGSINNLTDEIYFTRRATGYPGPGIIPAERRMFFFTLQIKV